MRVVVIGLGYVGLPLAVRAAEVGFHVTGVDLDRERLALLRAGQSYVEDVSDEQLADAVDRGCFDVADRTPDVFDIAVIAVPTPLHDGVPNLSYVHAAGLMLGPHLRPGDTVVLESTTHPGTTEGMLADTLAETSGLRPGDDFHLGFSPERIDPGSSVYTLRNTPKLVSATTERGLEVIDAFYRDIVDCTVRVSSPSVAEMAKVFENTQAYVNIALVNELSEICHDLDIDVHEMLDAAMTKGHSMARWSPGPGVGGHCLPIDPMYLAWQTRTHLGRRFRFAELADEINLARPQYVVDRAAAILEEGRVTTDRPTILVLGVAYKPGVGDVRESPAAEVVRLMSQRGLDVTVCDPYVERWTLTPRLALEELAGALSQFDLVVVATHHSEFDYGKISVEARRVLDCRRSVPPARSVVGL